ESPPTAAAEPPAPAAAEPAEVSPAPPPQEAPRMPEPEPERAIPEQAKSTETSPLAWSDPQAVFEAIRQNMPPKQRAELTMLLIDSNGRTGNR
ncbi:plasmid partitioning protein, partial [Streptomyces sp. NPDC031705]